MGSSTVGSAEEPFFLEGRSERRLFAIIHRSRQSESRRALVYCAPILEEKLNCHRIGVNFARRASAEGFSVLRFDYGGDGESSGDFVSASVEDRVDDVVAAAQWLRASVGADSIGLVGLRFGGSLALLAAEAWPSIGPVVMWAPALQGGPYLFEALRANLTSQLATHKKVVRDRTTLVAGIRAGEAVDVEGWEIGRALYEGAEAVDFLTRPVTTTAPTLAIHIGKRPLREPAFKEFVLANAGKGVRAASVDELEFWKPQSVAYPACDALFDLTLAWLRDPDGAEQPR